MVVALAACSPPPSGDDDDANGDKGGTSGSAGQLAGAGKGGSPMAGTGTGGTGTGGSATGGTGTGGSTTGGAGGTGNGGSSSSTGGTPATGGDAGMNAGGTAGMSVGGASPAGGSAGIPGGGDAGMSAGSAGGLSAGGSAGMAAAGASGTGGPVSATPDWFNPNFKEFVGEDCKVAEPMDVNDPKLPDLFKGTDGQRITTKAQWACQRAALKAIVEKYIHGPKPGSPDMVTGTVSKTSISVKVTVGSNSVEFSIPVTIPSNAKMPAPIMIGLGGGSLSKSILSAEGVATGNYSNNTISSEADRTGLFSKLYPNTGASAQVGWAWGISRVIDVLVAERDAGRNDIIDPTAVGITGCSRLGKGAFTIGAFDERIALGVPQESGTGGVSAFRIVNTNPKGPNGKTAQSLDSAWSEAQGWFGTVFGTYKSKVNVIPGDTHSLVAMYAPRGLLVLDNSRIGELGAVAQDGATEAGAMVYKALGVEKSVAYHGGNPTDPHNHCTFYEDTQGEPLRRAIRAHLTRTAPPDGRIEPQPVATVNLADWVTWDAPTLQ